MDVRLTARIMLWGTVLSAFAATMFICGAASALAMQDKSSAGTLSSLPTNTAARLTMDTSVSLNTNGIPENLHGSVSAGQAVYEVSCVGCHQNAYVLPATTFHGFKRRQRTGAMDGLELSDQETADVVAWLNRFTATHSEPAEILASAK